MSDSLESRIKQLIVETLNLPGVTPEEIADDHQLMGGELGLDSIDALELVVQIEREFGIKLENSEEVKQALQSVGSMAEQIRLHRARAN